MLKVEYSTRFKRDYKRMMKKEMNKEKIITNKEAFMKHFEELITTWEKTMYVSKKEWIRIIEELMVINKDLVRYL